MERKAQSQIITSVLIILLVLAAVVIVWQVVNSTIKDSSERVASQSDCLGIKIVVIDAESGKNEILIRREVGNSNLESVKPVLVVNDIKVSLAGRGAVNIELKELETKTLRYNFNKDDKVQVAGQLPDGTICGLSAVKIAK